MPALPAPAPTPCHPHTNFHKVMFATWIEEHLLYRQVRATLFMSNLETGLAED